MTCSVPLSLKSLIVIPAFFLLLYSCKQNTPAVRTNESSSVKDTVLKLAYLTAKDVSAKGPIAWLNYFEDSPDFLMVSDGIVMFTSYDAASKYIKNTSVKLLTQTDLKWSAIRIDPLSPQIALMGAKFHEDLTDTSGRVTPYDGYFTATAHQTPKGWKYRNVHWSMKNRK
jgi:hypothetical protein